MPISLYHQTYFDEDAIIFETWSNGEKHAYNDLNQPEITGTYQLQYNSNIYKLTINKDQENYNGAVQLKDSLKAKANVIFKNNLLTLSFPYDSTFNIRLNGNYNESDKSFTGSGQTHDGSWVDFKMNYITITDTNKQKIVLAKPFQKINYGKVYYPFCAYGEAEAESEGLIKDTWAKFKNVMTPF